MNWDLTQIPILQAPTGSIAGPELCAAVTQAGGMGAMGLTWTEPAEARGLVAQASSLCKSGAFQVNFVLHFEPKALVAVLEEGAQVITFSWGLPHKYVDLVRTFGAKFGIQVGTAHGAKLALDLGPDFLICQGVEAGGHVQSSIPLEQLLPQVLQVAGRTPVVAAGGLADGSDVARVMRMGASAAMLGTRFVATLESRAHPAYKQAIVEGSATALTFCFDGGWPNAAHRVLRNTTLESWEADGCPQPGQRPGEGEELARSGGEPILRYEDTAPRSGMSGDIEAMCLYAGAGCARIADIPPAGALVRKLWEGKLTIDSLVN